MESGKHQTSMELIGQIIARMKEEGAISAHSSEINRCLKGCVSGSKLIETAMNNRYELCQVFCCWSECSDGEIHSDHKCDCDEQIYEA